MLGNFLNPAVCEIKINAASLYYTMYFEFILLGFTNVKLVVCSVFRQGEDEPLKVSSVDDLERIRVSRHKLER